ncbi:HNH endonuclease [Amnibacterium flavum]|uniref:HNH endonuclease n=2 Tax=Amnibacterium flavum TaxID=2173173 RepID=A0A2V1HQ51_9MICO|nr:HNH endonuclease [Amnibacterium flavum]
MGPAALVVLAIVVALSLWVAARGQNADAQGAPSESWAGGSDLTSAVLALPAAGGSVAGYERDAFGDGWKDPDRNGCDARNDILARDLTSVTFRPGTHDCVVTSGVLRDPYTATVIDFVRGDSTSELVQIDHVVPLSWAWNHGAAVWDDATRELFANDPVNLLAVDGPTNSSKSDSGPAEWMPPDPSYHCAYASRFTEVLTEYRLGIDDADRASLLDIAAACA